MTRRGCGCCDSCDEVANAPQNLLLEEAGSNELHHQWGIGDLDNATRAFEGIWDITDDEITIHLSLLSDDAVSGGHSTSATNIGTVGAATYNTNRLIKFANHATQYTVLSHSGSVLEISPGLSTDVPDTTVIEDITPIADLGNPEAFYVRLELAAGDRIKIKNGTEVFDVDTAPGTLTATLNGGTARAFPDPDPSTSIVQVYWCPTHTMGEVVVTGNFGVTVIDDTVPTFTPEFSIEAIGTAQIRSIQFLPAPYPCPTYDLFPCYYPLFDKLADDLTADTVDLTQTGWDFTHDTCSYNLWYRVLGSPIFHGEANPCSNPPPEDLESFICGFIAYRSVAQVQGTIAVPQDFLISNYSSGVTVVGSFLITRATPSAGTPYPIPFNRVTLSVTDELCAITDVTELDRDVEDALDNFTIQTTLDRDGGCRTGVDTVVTWVLD